MISLDSIKKYKKQLCSFVGILLLIRLIYELTKPLDKKKKVKKQDRREQSYINEIQDEQETIERSLKKYHIPGINLLKNTGIFR